MPRLRRVLRWSSVAVLALSAPPVALAVIVAEKLRVRRRSRALIAGADTDVVVPLKPRRPTAHKSDELPPPGGAVILPFPRRRVVAAAPVDPQALTGSL